MYFEADEVAGLYEGLNEIDAKFRELRESFVLRPFQTAGAREHADHDFSRRLSALKRSVDCVFDILPPERTDIPDGTKTSDATTNIQAFVMNAFGCCENLAWIWVFERNIRKPSGAELPQGWVGLGQKYCTIYDSFSADFRDYLNGRHEWFRHLKDFRDSLAHRIPLYIPPFTLEPENAEWWSALEAEALAALRLGDIDREAQLRTEQKALARFAPIMTHSFSAGAPIVVFHPQLLADFNTIHEIGSEFLKELNR